MSNNYLLLQEILCVNEISLKKRVAVKILRRMVGKKPPAAVNYQLKQIDNAILKLKQGIIPKLDFLDGTFSVNISNDKKKMISSLYKLKSRLLHMSKVSNREMMGKVAAYGIVPPVLASGTGIAATYHAANKNK